VVKLLVEVGAKEESASAPQVMPAAPATSAQAALERSIPLLQRTDTVFLKKTGCVSRHNNTFTAMNVGIPGGADTCSYILLGLAAEKYPPNAATDAAARFLASRQLPDAPGELWRIARLSNRAASR